jgi:hypothetical protein
MSAAPLSLARVLVPLLAAFALPAAAEAQNVVLVERLLDVAVTRTGDTILVTAQGTVPIAGFSSPELHPRPDLVRVGGGIVLDFTAMPPGRGIVVPAETRLTAFYRIEPPAAAAIRFVQVRSARSSRTVQVTAPKP